MVDVPTAETLAFVVPHLTATPSRILEVGCGNGELAERLQALGHEVVALDSSAACVETARSRGVDVRIAHWPEFDAPPFDAILFTRSLHHIHPLDRAVARSRELLRHGGRVIVEDFAFNEVDPAGVEWLYQVLILLDAAQLLDLQGDSFAVKLLRHQGSNHAWHDDHEHHLHTAPAIAEAHRRHFPAVEMSFSPYFYRYVCAVLKNEERTLNVARRVLELELRNVLNGAFSWLGRRFVGSTAV